MGIENKGNKVQKGEKKGDSRVEKRKMRKITYGKQENVGNIMGKGKTMGLTHGKRGK